MSFNGYSTKPVSPQYQPVSGGYAFYGMPYYQAYPVYGAYPAYGYPQAGYNLQPSDGHGAHQLPNNAGSHFSPQPSQMAYMYAQQPTFSTPQANRPSGQYHGTRSFATPSPGQVPGLTPSRNATPATPATMRARATPTSADNKYHAARPQRKPSDLRACASPSRNFSARLAALSRPRERDVPEYWHEETSSGASSDFSAHDALSWDGHTEATSDLDIRDAQMDSNWEEKMLAKCAIQRCRVCQLYCVNMEKHACKGGRKA